MGSICYGNCIIAHLFIECVIMQIPEMNIGGHSGIPGGYFHHTIKGIDVGIPDFELLIIQEMHNAESGKIVRQSIGLGMMCYLQITEYQPRHYATKRFEKKIQFFGSGSWEFTMREHSKRIMERELYGESTKDTYLLDSLFNGQEDN